MKRARLGLTREVRVEAGEITRFLLFHPHTIIIRLMFYMLV